MADFNYYKGYPLVRKGNELYYGYMGEKCVARIQILDEAQEKLGDVIAYRIPTEKGLPDINSKRINLYDALDCAYTWIEMAKKEDK